MPRQRCRLRVLREHLAAGGSTATDVMGRERRLVRKIVEGKPALICVDIQGSDTPAGQLNGDDRDAIPTMGSKAERRAHSRKLVEKARANGVPIVFIQEAHRPSLVDFGRELDGAEDVHLVEGQPGTEYAPSVGFRPGQGVGDHWQSGDYFVRKRRYSAFFGTDLEILLKGLGVDTLVLIGGLTDVCVHYTFVDAHQHDYCKWSSPVVLSEASSSGSTVCRVVEDAVGGSSLEAHAGSLTAMEFLQTGARRQTSEMLAAFEEYGRSKKPPHLKSVIAAEKAL